MEDENRDILTEEYTLKVGRDKETGNPRWLTIHFNDKLHSPPDGQPAWVTYDDQGRADMQYWFYHGIPHRENGGAIKKINPETGICYYEEFRRISFYSMRNASTGVIERDPNSGVIIGFSGDIDESEPGILRWEGRKITAP